MPSCMSCLFLLLLILNLTHPTQSTMKVDKITGLFIEPTTNRVKFFHGVNVLAKLNPFVPDRVRENTSNSLTNADMINLHDEWGFNAVRIGVMWTAVQPHNNSHVQTAFLEETKQLITDLYKHGLYSLLDGHQDLLGPDMCGEGLPFWATNRALELRKFDRFSPLIKFPMPLPFQFDHDNITGFPNKSQCVEHLFIDYYSTFESSNSFAGLYFEQEMWGYFSSYWKIIATALHNVTGILAYELLNEPGPGDIYDPIYYPSDRTQLLPLYEATHQAIRSVDNDTIIFYEGIPTDQYEGEYLKGSTDLLAPAGPGGSEYADREAFAYHVYCPPGANEYVCDGMIDLAWVWLNRTKDRMTTGTHASIMTEFGAVGDDPASVRLIHRITTAADLIKQSWFYWTYRSYGDITTQNSHTETFFYPNGTLQKNKLKALTTTYPQSVAGRPASINYEFNRTDASFYMEYTTTKGDCNVVDSTSTEIYLNEKMWYPNGYAVHLTSTFLTKNVVWTSPQKNYIFVTHSPCGGGGEGNGITVSIVRR